MSALANGEDITAALGGSITSHVEEPGNQSLQRWKQQVKIMTTRITVVRRFTRTYRVKSFQCDIGPGLTAASPQKSNSSESSEGSETRNLSSVLNSGALFGPNAPIQDAPKQKFNSEKKNGEILKEADLLGWRIIVTVIGLDPRQEGTTATYNHVLRTVLTGLLLLLCLGSFPTSGANAQADSEEGKLESPNERTVDLPYNVQLAAWTLVAGIFIAVIAGRINRRPLVPPPAPPVLPVPPVPVPLIGFVNVMDVLDENPDAARISDPDFYILPPLE